MTPTELAIVLKESIITSVNINNTLGHLDTPEKYRVPICLIFHHIRKNVTSAVLKC